MSFWTDEKLTQLAQLTKDPDLSADDIGKRVGTTRNAVLGKIHREKMPWARRDNITQKRIELFYKHSGRPSRLAKTDAQRTAAGMPIKSPEQRAEAILRADGWVPRPEILPAVLVKLANWDTDRGCMAPFLDNPVLFGCCEARVPGTSYCEKHLKRFLALPDPRTQRKLDYLINRATEEDLVDV
jgi:hypothetical protein